MATVRTPLLTHGPFAPLFPNAQLTPAGVPSAPMDAIFILIIVVLYAATHWLIWALSRLGGVE